MRDEMHIADLSDVMNRFWKLYVKEYRAADFNTEYFWSRIIAEFSGMVKKYDKTNYHEQAMNIAEALLADLEQESR